MPLLGIRAFSKAVSRHVDAVVETGKPVVLTRHGRPVAAVIPVDESMIDDFVLANMAEFPLGLRAADAELVRGETSTLAEILDEMNEDNDVEEQPEEQPKSRRERLRAAVGGATRR